MIQLQHWLSCDRVLITDETRRASVQVDIFKRDDFRRNYRADALLYALWVDEPHRRQGAARLLIEAAEREAASHGCRSLALEWDRREAAEWTLSWYQRLGYEEEAFGNHNSLLVKQLRKGECNESV